MKVAYQYDTVNKENSALFADLKEQRPWDIEIYRELFYLDIKGMALLLLIPVPYLRFGRRLHKNAMAFFMDISYP